MGRGRHLGVALILVALALAAIGCGGSSSSGDSSASDGSGASETLTRAEILEQGDAICTKTEEEKNKALLVALNKHSKGSKVDRAFEENLVTTVALPPISQMADELAELNSGKDPGLTAVIAAFDKAVKEIEESPASVLTGGTEPLEAPDKLAKQYGFKSCAEI